MLWGSYGQGDGFTESQWADTDANVGDLDRWSVGVGFAYGGWLPGLMRPDINHIAHDKLIAELARGTVEDEEDIEDRAAGFLERFTSMVWTWQSLVALTVILTAVCFYLWHRRRKNHGR